VGEGAELAGELLGDDALGRQAAAQQALEIPELARLEALGIAVDRDGWRPLAAQERAPI
jgi:hypothetical protein